MGKRELFYIGLGALLYYGYLSFVRHSIGGNPLRPMVVAAA